MAKTIEIFGVTFIEREDGLYECVDSSVINEKEWGYSDYYGMGLSWRLIDGKELPWLLCPSNDLIDTFNEVTSKDSRVCLRSWTLDCNPDNLLGTLF